MSLRCMSRALVAAGAVAAAAGALSGCVEAQGPGYYGPYEQGAVAQVDEGVVVSSRPIHFGPGDTRGGALVGGVAGAIAGSAAAGRYDRGAGAVLGAVGGALIGDAIASSDRRPGFAYLIRRSDGRLVEIPQADAQPIPDGVRVSVSYGPGRRARVWPIGAAAPPPPPPPPPPAH